MDYNEVTISINNVKHRLVETDSYDDCDNCSLVKLCDTICSNGNEPFCCQFGANNCEHFEIVNE